MTGRIDAGAQRVLDLGRAARSRPFEDGTPEQARKDYNAGAPALKAICNLSPLLKTARSRDRMALSTSGSIAASVHRRAAGAGCCIFTAADG